MKKIIALALSATLALTMLAGCGEGGNSGNNNGKNNTAPTISGVPETATVMVGEEWNALQGVTATDKEDGDLTSKIEVSARGLTFTGGKTTPTEARESSGYQVRYSVKDSGGMEAEEQFCVLYVKQAAAGLVTVYESDFSDVTPDYDWTEGHEGEGNNHWWSLKKENGAEATATLTEGRLAIDVTNRNSAADYQLMLTRNFADLAVGRYKFAVWAKTPSSGTVKLNMIAELNENSSASSNFDDRNLGGTKEIELTSQYQVFALDFELTQEKLKAGADQGEVLFRIGLGVGDNPNAFKVDIEKIIIWKTTGSNADNDLFTLNPAPSTGGLEISNLGDGAQATLGYDTAEQAVKLDITQYNTTAGVWSIVLKAPLTGATLEAGTKYGIEVEMKANTGFTPEFVVGRSENGKDADPRFVKNDTAITNSAYTKIKGEFELETTTPYIFFQLGKNITDNLPAVNTNVIYIKSIRLYEVESATTETNLFTMAPATENGGLSIDHNWEDAASTLAYDATEQAVKIDITKYNTAGGAWVIVAKAPLTDVTLAAGNKYGIEVEMKATTEIKPGIIITPDDNRDNSSRFIKNDTAVGNTYTKIKGEFDGFATTATHLFFELGKINDTNYPNVTSNVIYIKSIRLFKIEEGVSTEGDELYALDAGAVSGGGTIEITNQGDGAANVTAGSAADGAKTINIATYNTTGGCWSIIATIPTGVTLDTSKTYGYEIEIKATSAFSNAEMHFGPKTNSDEGDKWYSADIGTIGTAYRTLRHTFKPGAAYSDPSLHLFLGKDPANNTATTNTVYIKSFRFFEVTGNEETSKFQDKFILFGDASPDKTNEKYPISVYNQSDDVFDAAPMGTAYMENGKLVYLIHQGGSDWGHNKLAFGYGNNPIGPLPANAYYVVSFKIKASVALDFSLTLHDMDMGWDEAEGGIPIRYADYGGHEMLHAGTTETTIEITSPMASLVAHEKCELLLEFGKFLGTNKDVRIEISDLKIGYRTVQA